MKVKNYLVLMTVFSLLTFVSVSIASAMDKKNEVVFYPQGDAQINPVTLTIDGKVYTESGWFDEVPKGLFQPADDEKFILKIVETNRNGKEQEILELWSPDERDQKRASVFNKDNFKSNRAYFGYAKHSAFRAKINYGSYIIFLIQHSGVTLGDDINAYVIKKTDKNYYLTEKLEEDYLYIWITQSYKKTLGIKQWSLRDPKN